MMNKSLRARARESSRKTYYGFHLVRDGRTLPKKRAAVSGGFEVDNREASNRVDRSHSVSKRGRSSHRREALINRKRTILFSLRLPCPPLAERGCRRHDLSSSCPALCRASTPLLGLTKRSRGWPG